VRVRRPLGADSGAERLPGGLSGGPVTRAGRPPARGPPAGPPPAPRPRRGARRLHRPVPLGDDAGPLRVGLLLAGPLAARLAPAHETLSLFEAQLEWRPCPGAPHPRRHVPV